MSMIFRVKGDDLFILKRCITTKSTDSNATLIDMLPGQTGIITEIDQGHGLARKLLAMGIIPGKKVVKVSQIIGRANCNPHRCSRTCIRAWCSK